MKKDRPHVTLEIEKATVEDMVGSLDKTIAEYQASDKSKLQTAIFVAGSESEDKDGTHFNCAVMGPPPLVAAALIDIGKLMISAHPAMGLFMLMSLGAHIAEEARKHSQGLTDAQLDAFDKLIDKATKGELDDNVRSFLENAAKGAMH